jgi:hypothetical protein
MSLNPWSQVSKLQPIESSTKLSLNISSMTTTFRKTSDPIPNWISYKAVKAWILIILCSNVIVIFHSHLLLLLMRKVVKKKPKITLECLD